MVGVACELQRELLHLLDCSGDEVGQADGTQQAPRHAGSERPACAGHYREPGPERVAGRRVGVVRKCVQEEIGHTMPCQVSLIARPPGEYQPLRRDPISAASSVCTP